MYEKNILEIKGPSAIDQIFLEGTKERLKEVLSIASQNELPEAKASSSNCRYCKFNDLCPEASKDEALIITNDLFWIKMELNIAKLFLQFKEIAQERLAFLSERSHNHT